MFGDIFEWIKEHKKLTIAGMVILSLLGLWGVAKKAQERKLAEAEAALLAETEAEEELETESTESYKEGTDEFLMSLQTELRKQYGTPPKGFIWDSDGSPISLGDKEMSSEDVLYAYLRAISTLDFATAEKYSRGAVVPETYEGYFDEKNKLGGDYEESFQQSFYRESLLSLEVEGVEASSSFAKNKVVYTINVSMLDLTNKDFWLQDKEKLFESMYVYESEEDDSAKLELFLYDYILNYYKSEQAVKRTFPVDITLQRYPDIDSGWLVSIDTDIDKASKYSDGKIVTRYMVELFREYVQERQRAELEKAREGQ